MYANQAKSLLYYGIGINEFQRLYNAMEGPCEDFVNAVVEWATPDTKHILEEYVVFYEEDECV